MSAPAAVAELDPATSWPWMAMAKSKPAAG